ncbi:MAG: glycogen/starch/alpha-glucan phosphorylase [Longimicrobiaceae bacterium]
MTKPATATSPPSVENGRRATRVDVLKRAVSDHLTYTLARDRGRATDRDVYRSVVWGVRDRLAERWAATEQDYGAGDAKRVYYLSLEFLMGRALGNALLNLDLEGEAAEALEQLGYHLEELRELEPDAGLGNGGLGRLAACYLDSMATLGIAGYGYGIRYEHGIFRQKIVAGRQVEVPDSWLQFGNPWEIERPERRYLVNFHGRVESNGDGKGRTHYRWVDTSDVLAVAYDTPIPGYRNAVVNTLRLWAARSTEEFDLKDFIQGDYLAAVESKIQGETISKVLYPPDDTGSGKELRLKQQHFFVSATLQDILNRYKRERKTFADFPDKVQIQLNDTHPALAVPELMRLLMDEEGLEWEKAWGLVRRTFAYTNHTVLPEALERWDEELFGQLLPRHLTIVHEIDRRFREEVAARFTPDLERVERMAILSGGEVRMANLALVASHTVNGVAGLHSQILRERVFRDFHQLWPEKLISVTNGVTPRRWVMKANPSLSGLLDRTIGDGWRRDLTRLDELAGHAADADFRQEWRGVKRANRERLARMIQSETGVELNPGWMFDVQVKRLHEYKRQLLNALRVADLYLELRDNPELDVAPRAVIFGGKAAPTYWTAKLVIHFINAVAAAVNAERATRDKLRVVFLPDYRVSLAETVFPGSDLSEQISTAGYEASGTGNMKFALGGALTIGTMDGANVEIAEAVGRENVFIFGLSSGKVAGLKAGGYDPRLYYQRSARLRRVIDFVAEGGFSPGEPELFQPLAAGLLESDPFLVLADFDSYLEAQERVDEVWREPERWTSMSILNTAHSGFFSSDRSVREYAERVWRV